jgi:hypothetical protein
MIPYYRPTMNDFVCFRRERQRASMDVECEFQKAMKERMVVNESRQRGSEFRAFEVPQRNLPKRSQMSPLEDNNGEKEKSNGDHSQQIEPRGGKPKKSLKSHSGWYSGLGL